MNTPPPTRPNGKRPMILQILWGILVGTAAWRVELAMTGAAAVHWRRLDEFLPWIVLALFTLSADAAARSLRQVRAGRVFAVAIGIGAIFTGLDMGLDQAGVAGAGPMGVAAVVVMALTCAGLAVREVRRVQLALRGDSGKGITIIDLWRFAAAQWCLLMAVAMAWIVMSKSRDQRLGDAKVQLLMCLLPAAAVLPNVLMAGGISLWNELLLAAGMAAPKPRLRAWLVAFAAMHLGPVVFLTGLLPRVGMGVLVYPGAAITFAGIVLYFAGFPRSVWRGSVRGPFAGWVLLAAALVGFLLEWAVTMRGDTVSIYYGSAWRYLWGTGAVVFWVLGWGKTALSLQPLSRQVRLGTLAAVFGKTGVVVTTVALVLASMYGAASGTALLIAGTVLVLTAMLFAGLVILSSARRPDRP